MVFKKEKENQSENICRGISKNGNKCCRQSSENNEYCKTHQYLSFRQIVNEPKVDNLFIIESNSFDRDTKNMELQLIEDSFYYVDNFFVYEKETLKKVGYVENKEYILTDDPFILNC